MRRSLHLASPPRRVSPLLTASTLVGGTVAFLGWMFFGLGLLFAGIFVSPGQIWSLDEFGPTELVIGRAVGSTPTNARENDVEVVEVRYEYETLEGRLYEGVGYTTGIYYDQGEELDVLYLLDDPARSEAPRLRRSTFGPLALIVLIFPAFGLTLVTVKFVSGLRTVRLLSRGAFALGRRARVEPTSTRINKRTVYRYTIEYTDADNRIHHFEFTTHETEGVEDEEKEPILYDPDRPDRAVLLDGLAVRAHIAADGGLDCHSVPASLVALVIPSLTVLGHGAYLLTGWPVR